MRGLDDLDSQANAAAEDKQRKAFAADDARKELRAQEAAERKAEEARAAEQRQAQEQAKQLAATETAQREPLPKSVTQFDAHLDRTAKQSATPQPAHRRRQSHQSRCLSITPRGFYALRRIDRPPCRQHARADSCRVPRLRRARLQSRPQPQLERAKSNSPFAPCRSLKSNMSRSGTPQTQPRGTPSAEGRAHPTTPCARSPPDSGTSRFTR